MNTIGTKKDALYQYMLNKQIPDLMKEYSGFQLDDYTVDFEMYPITNESTLEENGTSFVMLKAICTLSDNVTHESHEFPIDLLKIPSMSTLGFKIKGNYMQILDAYTRATGFNIQSDLDENLLEDSNLHTDLSKRNVSLHAKDKTVLHLVYQKSRGILVQIRNKKVPISVFLQAITNKTREELLAMFGLDNLFLVDAFTNKNKVKDPDTGDIRDLDNKAKCIKYIYQNMFVRNKEHSSDDLVDMQNEINRVLFSKIYSNLGNCYADRLTRTISFRQRANGKVLEQDINVWGRCYEQGTILQESVLDELDNLPVDSIVISFNNKNHRLFKFSELTFRALGCQLDEAVNVNGTVINKGTILDFDDLKLLNESDLAVIKVITPDGDKTVLKRRVHPQTLHADDLLSILSIYANILNDLDSFENQYELSNRVVVTFNNKICDFIERAITQVLQFLRREVRKLSDNELLLEAITNFKLNTDAFLISLSTSDIMSRDNDAQMSDMNNPLHHLSKNYKATTDISSQSASDDLKRVQDLQAGRLDSIDSPESNKIGLTHVRTMLAEETADGFLTAPYLKVKNGKVVSNEPIYITAQEEEDKYIAEWNETFVNEDGTPKQKIKARYNSDIVMIDANKVELKEFSQLQTMSPARGLIPHMGNSNSKRLLMACNHGKQAVPPLDPERPIDGTGVECIIDFGTYTAEKITQMYYDNNIRISPELEQYKEEIIGSVIRLVENGISETHKLRKITFEVEAATKLLKNGIIKCTNLITVDIIHLQKTYEKSLYTNKIVPAPDFRYKGKDVVIANILYDTKSYNIEVINNYGGLKVPEETFRYGYGAGKNIVVGYKTSGGTTIDDALTISSRLFEDDVYTSVFYITKKYECKNTIDDSEEFSAPSNCTIDYLDSKGLPKVGTMLKPGDVYMSIVRSSDKAIRAPEYKRLDEYTTGQVVSSEIYEKDGKIIGEVVLATYSNIEVGDKMSGRCGNKGVVAKIVPYSEMPYNPETGLTLDICLNPLGIPSRMNITQLLEVTLSLLKKSEDKIIIIPPFDDTYDIDTIQQKAEECGLSPMMLCDGRTGEMFKRPVNVGIQYMQKLVHMVRKKVNAVGLNAPVDPVFQQPVKGQKRGGGQGLGEMEAWVFQSVGANKVLQELTTIQSDDVEGKALSKDILRQNPACFNYTGKNHNDYAMEAYLRSMGVELSIADDGLQIFRPLTDAKIRALNPKAVTHADALHDESIFGAQNTAEAKMKSKAKWSYINLKCQIVSPYWLAKGKLNKFIGVINIDESNAESDNVKPRIASEQMWVKLFNGEYSIGTEFSDYGYVYLFSSKLPESAIYFNQMPKLTGMSAIVYIFQHYNASDTISIYNTAIESKESNWLKSHDSLDEIDSDKAYLDLLHSRAQLTNYLELGGDLSDYVVSSFPVMPQMFRPDMSDLGPGRSSDFDKSYKEIINANNNVRPDNEESIRILMIAIDNFLGIKWIKSKSGRVDKQRTTLNTWFTGSGSTSKSKHKGKIRENILKKKILCAGRSVITPTSIEDMKATELGVPLSMLLKIYRDPLIGFISNSLKISGGSNATIKDTYWDMLFNAIASQNENNFRIIYKEHFRRYCKLESSTTMNEMEAYSKFQSLIKTFIEMPDSEGVHQVIILGRQPSLHVFSIRAFIPKIVYTKSIQIHPLVCSGYNADFDGDTTWLAGILQLDARTEALELMSPRECFINPKDCSQILLPQQDIALGVYCATMLKNNATSVYQTPEVLKDIRYYSNLEMLKHDLDSCNLEYHSLVIYTGKGVDGAIRSYYSTAGRIMFNSLLPDAFTDKPFSNTLYLPIPDAAGFSSPRLSELKYDGIVAVKGGNRDDIKYCNLGKICEEVTDTYGGESIDYLQRIVEFGFHTSDIFAVTLGLADVNIKLENTKLEQEMADAVSNVEESFSRGDIDAVTRKKLVKTYEGIIKRGTAGKKLQPGEDLKDIILAEADKKKSQLEEDYQIGLLSAADRKAGIQQLYSKASSTIKGILPYGMSRNNNLFIIFDSGARGNVGQVMQTCGLLGILQKTKTQDMEIPVTSNYAKGLSSFDVHLTTFSTRTGVSSTQNETADAGYATRTSVYMQNGIEIVEDDCGKANWWYETKWEGFKAIKLIPSLDYFNQNLLGKQIDKNDAGTLEILHDCIDDSGCITADGFNALKAGFSSLVLVDNDNVFDITISQADLINQRFLEQEADEDTVIRLKTSLSGSSSITNDTLKMIVKHHVREVPTSNGTYVFYYELAPVTRSLLINREAKDVNFEGMPGLNYLKPVHNPNAPGTFIKVITKKTLDDIESRGLKMVPARIMLDCHSIGGVCAHCYGMRYSNYKIPLVGENVGIESAQAMGEPAAQLTMSLFHKGGAAGESIAGGVEVFTHALNGTNPGGINAPSAIIAKHSGYLRLRKLDANALGFIEPINPEDSTLCASCMSDYAGCPLRNKMYSAAKCKVQSKLPCSRLLVQDNEYVDQGDALTSGYILPDTIEYKTDIEKLIRKKQIVWLDTYFDTFKRNGIDIMARHFESLVRAQNSRVTVIDAADTDLKVGEMYNFMEVLDKVGPEKINDMKLSFKIDKKHNTVIENSGTIAMVTYEDVAGTLASIVTTGRTSRKVSPIAKSYTGTDMSKSTIKPLMSSTVTVVNFTEETEPEIVIEPDTLIQDSPVTTKSSDIFQGFNLDAFSFPDLDTTPKVEEPVVEQMDAFSTPKAEEMTTREVLPEVESMDIFGTPAASTIASDPINDTAVEPLAQETKSSTTSDEIKRDTETPASMDIFGDASKPATELNYSSDKLGSTVEMETDMSSLFEDKSGLSTESFFDTESILGTDLNLDDDLDLVLDESDDFDLDENANAAIPLESITAPSEKETQEKQPSLTAGLLDLF